MGAVGDEDDLQSGGRAREADEEGVRQVQLWWMRGVLVRCGVRPCLLACLLLLLRRAMLLETPVKASR